MKKGFIGFAAIALSLGAYNTAHALVNVEGTVNTSVSATVDNTGASANANIKASTSASSTKTKGNATSTKATTTQPAKDTSTTSRATTTGSITAEEHRSAVATFVKNLLSVADRQPGIGNQVRAIAKEQNDSSSTTIEAMAEAQSRSKVKTFLIGTDYKNIGVIRSELAKTEKRIERLQELRDDTFNLNDRAALDAEIASLTKIETDVSAFVEANEGQFSLFGWFAKLFQ